MIAQFPKLDSSWEEASIARVGRCGDGWTIERADGWSFFVPSSSPVTPKVGMTARFYGEGIGRPVRGLFLGGVQVFYRTEAEDKFHQNTLLYGSNPTEWLKRWDAGQTVWSIEMGGLGPGYEQAIQIAAAEILRHLLEKSYDAMGWLSSNAWANDRAAIETYGFANARVQALQLSGAQWNAALSLATALYKNGPIALALDARNKERLIQVSRRFPVLP